MSLRFLLAAALALGALFPSGSVRAQSSAFETVVPNHAIGFSSLDDAKRFATLIWVENDIAAGKAFARERSMIDEVKDFRKGARVIVEERAPGPVPGVDNADWRCARMRGDPTCYWAPGYLILGDAPDPAGAAATPPGYQAGAASVKVIVPAPK